MQIFGFFLLAFVVWFGFSDRTMGQISAFDPHALVMVLVGSCLAVLVSSSGQTALRTVLCLRECIPGARFFSKTTRAMEAERDELCRLWREGKRNAALQLAEKSTFPAIKKLVDLLLNRSAEAGSANLPRLRHGDQQWQPPINNWEMLSKLGPAFGMVGTITGIIRCSGTSSDNLNIARVYDCSPPSRVASKKESPARSAFLNGLLDERLGFLERARRASTSWSRCEELTR